MSRYRITDQFTAKHVRLIDPEGEQLGIFSIEDARGEALKRGLDLVIISPTAEPPVVRIGDPSKYCFEESKQKASAKKKQKRTKLKEMKFRPVTDKGDYDIKVRKLREFLEEGNKAKVVVFFKGRELMHHELGFKLLERVKEDLSECSKVEFFPKLEGKQLIMILSPKKAV